MTSSVLPTMAVCLASQVAESHPWELHYAGPTAFSLSTPSGLSHGRTFHFEQAKLLIGSELKEWQLEPNNIILQYGPTHISDSFNLISRASSQPGYQILLLDLTRGEESTRTETMLSRLSDFVYSSPLLAREQGESIDSLIRLTQKVQKLGTRPFAVRVVPKKSNGADQGSLLLSQKSYSFVHFSPRPSIHLQDEGDVQFKEVATKLSSIQTSIKIIFLCSPELADAETTCATLAEATRLSSQLKEHTQIQQDIRALFQTFEAQLFQLLHQRGVSSSTKVLSHFREIQKCVGSSLQTPTDINDLFTIDNTLSLKDHYLDSCPPPRMVEVGVQTEPIDEDQVFMHVLENLVSSHPELRSKSVNVNKVKFLKMVSLFRKMKADMVNVHYSSHQGSQSSASFRGKLISESSKRAESSRKSSSKGRCGRIHTKRKSNSHLKKTALFSACFDDLDIKSDLPSPTCEAESLFFRAKDSVLSDREKAELQELMGIDRDSPLDTLLVRKFIYGDSDASNLSHNLQPPTQSSFTTEKKKRPPQLPAAPPSLSSMRIRQTRHLTSSTSSQRGSRVVPSSTGKPPLLLRESYEGPHEGTHEASCSSSRSRSESRSQVLELDEIPTFTTKTLDQMVIPPESKPRPIVPIQKLQLSNPKKLVFKQISQQAKHIREHLDQSLDDLISFRVEEEALPVPSIQISNMSTPSLKPSSSKRRKSSKILTLTSKTRNLSSGTTTLKEFLSPLGESNAMISDLSESIQTKKAEKKKAQDILLSRLTKLRRLEVKEPVLENLQTFDPQKM